MADKKNHEGSSAALTPTTTTGATNPPVSNARVTYPGDSSSPRQANHLETMQMVPQDLSPVSRVPFMPILDLEIEEFARSSPQYFLATPAEILLQKGVSEFGQNQGERLEQFRSIEQGTHRKTSDEECCSARTPTFHQATFLGDPSGHADENVDDMMDEEVAVASARASRRRSASALTSKFRLRPKPLREEDSCDPDFFFRD